MQGKSAFCSLPSHSIQVETNTKSSNFYINFTVISLLVNTKDYDASMMLYSCITCKGRYMMYFITAGIRETCGESSGWWSYFLCPADQQEWNGSYWGNAYFDDRSVLFQLFYEVPTVIS